ncbi:hypothetical protein HKX48_009401 [Thoreauomyces humboldtii]|nr:hypothetical protein HKX48_009401 [Thoreauomyces humboldtii]
MRKLWAIPLGLHLLLLAALGLLPSSRTRWLLPAPLKNNDKLLHYVSFAVLAFLSHVTLGLPSIARTALWTAAGVGGAAFASEVLQAVVGIWSGRLFDFEDILANLYGGTTGLAMAVLADTGWRAFLERRKGMRRHWTPVTTEDNDFDLEGLDDSMPLNAMP